MDIFIDSELVILQVQENECIYNLKGIDYKNCSAMVSAWKNISTFLMGEKWD